MRRLIKWLPILRISIGFVGLTVSLLFAALALGLIPDRHGAVVAGRKTLCEAVAIQSTAAVQRGDLDAIKDSVEKIVRRNPEILSAAVRSAQGETLIEIGEHQNYWELGPNDRSTDTQMKVPFASKDKLWGTLELRFQPVAGPILPLVAFIGGVGFFVYFGYLWRILRKVFDIDPSTVPKRVRASMDTLSEGVLILDRDQRIALANEAFAKMIGKSPEELEGCNASELPWVRLETADATEGAPGDKEAAEPARNRYPWELSSSKGEVQTGVVLGLQANTLRPRTLSINSTPILGNDGGHRGALATFDNLSTIEKKNNHLRKLLQGLKQSREEIRRQNQELEVLATREPLTSCLNRRAFFAELEKQWQAAVRYGYPLSCVMLDVDHFKSVNDRFGHKTGDEVLQHVAKTLESLVRKKDLVCRYGGEEFCVLLPHVDVEGAAQAAERFRKGLESRKCGEVMVTASFGVSALSLGPQEPSALLDQADKGLYAAKRLGRNRVMRWDMVPTDIEIHTDATCRRPAPREAEAGAPISFHAVTALVAVMSQRYPDTAEHCKRVADLCVATAKGLMSHRDRYVLEVGALLHDIGKMGVPDAVLLKPGPLTDEEWKIIRTHELIGEEIIAAAFTSPELTEIVRRHHGWFAGNPRNPNEPKSCDAPLPARILAIADAYDAMVSDRVYRKAMSRDHAFAELRRCAGKQFDPELVERFISTVATREANTNAPTPTLSVTKQTALKIGLQIEKLACVIDTEDFPMLSAMANRLHVAACECNVDPISTLSARLEQKCAAANPDRAELMQLTLELLELCRTTYRSCLSVNADSGVSARMPIAPLAPAISKVVACP